MPASTFNAIVTVNGLPSVCTASCAYTFASTTFEITSQVMTGNAVRILMTNPQAKAITNSQIMASVSGKICTIVSGTPTDFICTLPVNPDGSPELAAGSFDVALYIRSNGFVPVRVNTPKITVALNIDSVSPAVNGTNGGYQVTL